MRLATSDEQRASERAPRCSLCACALLARRRTCSGRRSKCTSLSLLSVQHCRRLGAVAELISNCDVPGAPACSRSSPSDRSTGVDSVFVGFFRHAPSLVRVPARPPPMRLAASARPTSPTFSSLPNSTCNSQLSHSSNRLIRFVRNSVQSTREVLSEPSELRNR